MQNQYVPKPTKNHSINPSPTYASASAMISANAKDRKKKSKQDLSQEREKMNLGETPDTQSSVVVVVVGFPLIQCRMTASTTNATGAV